MKTIGAFEAVRPRRAGWRLAAVLAAVVTGALLWAWPAAARASRWQGQVTHVSDGDTVWVQPADGGAPRKIRIDGIDAPEICQRYGETARDALAGRIQGQVVQVTARGKDDYGRLLAHLSEQEHDVGAWMVVRGHAWSYRYRHSAGPYAALEEEARARGLGLWQQARPMPPRVFRQRHGSCH